MSKIIAVTEDLLFSSNIETALTREDHEVHVVEDFPSLERGLLKGGVQLVLLDLHSGAEAGAVVMMCRPMGVPVLAFGRHTEAALLRQAREVGCAEVVARSTFVEEMAQLVARNSGRTAR